MQDTQTRRGFLTSASAAGAAGLLGAPAALAAEPPPETRTIRFARSRSICLAPLYSAEELLREEGFTDIAYVPTASGTAHAKALGRGEIDLTQIFAPPILINIDGGEPISILAGIHVGCFELFGNSSIRSIADLKGKTVGIFELGAATHVFLASMATHVGLDPGKDINWVTGNTPKDLFAAGKIDAFLGFPPEPQELRARKIGRVVVNSSTDRPWSQYFCCVLAGNKEWVRKHPVATKRAMRAILKATDHCAMHPERDALRLVEQGITPRLDYALQALKEMPYDKWHVYHPEDTVRFYALRLHEAGMIKTSPNKILAQGTDWRLLTDLKRELKG